MKKKTNVIIGVVGVIAVALVVLYFTGMLNKGLYLFQEPNLCSEAPSDPDCYCLEGDERLEIEFGTLLPRFFCEKEIKLIDIDTEDWESQAIDIGEQKLSELQPDCDMKLCDRENTEWVVTWGYPNLERRGILIDCEDLDKGFRFATISYDIVNGAVIQARCGNYNDIVQETVSENPININLNDIYDNQRNGYIRKVTSFSSDCGDKDNGMGISTMYAPYGNIGEWQLLTGGYGFNQLEDGRSRITHNLQEGTTTVDLDFGSCTIIESTPDYATILCDTECPHVGFSGLRLIAVGYYTDEYWNSLFKCTDTDNNRYFVGDTIVCNSEKTKYECQEDGTWKVIQTMVSSTYSHCPV